MIHLLKKYELDNSTSNLRSVQSVLEGALFGGAAGSITGAVGALGIRILLNKDTNWETAQEILCIGSSLGNLIGITTGIFSKAIGMKNSAIESFVIKSLIGIESALLFYGVRSLVNPPASLRPS